jgi:transposase
MTDLLYSSYCRKWKKAAIGNDNDKVPVIVFGDARFGRNKKGSGSLADKCRVLLKKADKAGELIFIPMDEYMTSQVCSKCGHRTLSNKVTTGPGRTTKRMYTVLVCNHCHTVWQRDVNASRNIRALFLNMVTSGRRPGLLARHPTNQ